MVKIWYGLFNSTADDRRPLTAEEWASYISSFITTGIKNGGTCLEVTAKENRIVKMDVGIANIEGYIFRAEEDKNGRYTDIELPYPHNRYARYDRIVLRLDRRVENRLIEVFPLMGEASENPVSPELTRNEEIYEISLAKVFVRANTTVITDNDITDERLDENLCGLINSVLGVETSHFQRQFDEFMAELETLKEEYLEDFKAKWEERFTNIQDDFVEWYRDVRLDITKL